MDGQWITIWKDRRGSLCKGFEGTEENCERPQDTGCAGRCLRPKYIEFEAKILNI